MKFTFSFLIKYLYLKVKVPKGQDWNLPLKIKFVPKILRTRTNSRLLFASILCRTQTVEIFNGIDLFFLTLLLPRSKQK